MNAITLLSKSKEERFKILSQYQLSLVVGKLMLFHNGIMVGPLDTADLSDMTNNYAELVRNFGKTEDIESWHQPLFTYSRE